MLLWNPKVQEQGRFEPYFRLLVIKWTWLPTFRRSAVPFFSFNFPRTLLFIIEADPNKFLRNVYKYLPLDMVQHPRKLGIFIPQVAGTSKSRAYNCLRARGWGGVGWGGEVWSGIKSL